MGTNMSLFRECQLVAEDLQQKVSANSVKFNKSLCKLLANTYSSSLDASKFGLNEVQSSSKCEKPVAELRRIMRCGELLVTQWTDTDWWKTVISSSDSASLQEKVVLHLNEFLACVKVLKLIATGNEHMLFGHTFVRLEVVKDLELSMSNVKSDVEKAYKEDIDSLISWIQDLKKKWHFPQNKPADLVLEEIRPSNSSHAHQSSKLEYRDVTITRPIGRGGFANVHKCNCLGLPAAAKVFRKECPNAEVESEASSFGTLRHPNIVRFIAYVAQNDQHVIVSELMSKDLRKYLDENKRKDGTPQGRPLFEAVDIMLQIAEAMRYLHERGMIHRDLKSKNILVTVIPSPDSSSVKVKVTDFGLAKLKLDDSKFTSKNVCTIPWRAPEVFGDNGHNTQKYGKSADVYSFAMVFFEVLTGKTPFENIRRDELLDQLRRGTRPPLHDDCPKYLSALIKKCWAWKGADRPSFGTVCKTLRNCKAAILAGLSPPPRHILSYESDDKNRKLRDLLLDYLHK